RRKAPGSATKNGQPSHNLFFAKEGDGQQRPISELSQYGPHASGTIFLFIENISYFHGRSGKCRLSQRATTEVYGTCAQSFDKLFLDLVAAAKMKYFRLFVVLVDDSSGSPGQLDRVGGDARKHRFQIQRGTDRLTDFAQRLEFSDRTRQLPRAGLQFLEQTHVLDGNHRLISKRFKELDLHRGEGTYFHAACDQRPHEVL